MSQAYDPAFEPTTAERVARNDAIFRDANERIREAAEEHGPVGAPVPFICECADPGCRELVPMTLDAYRSIRSHPAHFLNARGHDAAAHGWVKVVAARDTYVVVEKIGEARVVAEKLVAGSGELAPPRADP